MESEDTKHLDTKYLEEKPISDEELAKLKEDLPKGKRLVETSPNHYKVLERMNG